MTARKTMIGNTQQTSGSKQRKGWNPSGAASQNDGALLTPIDQAPHANPIIVHCHLRWDFVWQRPQQIFSRLAREHAILFLEDAIGGEGSARLEITEPSANLVRVVPVVPDCQNLSVDDQCKIILPLLKAALRTHSALRGRFERPVQWFYSPMTAPGFLNKLDAVAVVYDCMDELANFRFAPPDIAAREKLLLEEADVVFTGGYQLFQAKSRHHSNTHFYGCGVDVQHFGKARAAQTEVPADLASLPRPIFGYFGVIDERLDYELIDRLAGAFPNATVAMVGPFAKVDPATLPRLPNIHWLGPRTYDELPPVVKAFDVCLMPFAMNEATKFINPTKTLEYMAGGKPVVSTAVPDVVHNFTPIVKVAYSPDEFVAAVNAAASDPDQTLISQGIEMAARSSWDSTVARMRTNIFEAIRARAPAKVVKSKVAALLMPAGADLAPAVLSTSSPARLNAET